jgi:hypothetical protein
MPCFFRFSLKTAVTARASPRESCKNLKQKRISALTVKNEESLTNSRHEATETAQK